MYVEDAKADEKVCPQQSRCCRGSECMAWRWQVTHTVLSDYPYSAQSTVSDTVGYCGMAGKPEA